MNKDYYIDVIMSGNDETIGIELGKAIKDVDISAERFDSLCKFARSKGFSFVYLQLVK